MFRICVCFCVSFQFRRQREIPKQFDFHYHISSSHNFLWLIICIFWRRTLLCGILFFKYVFLFEDYLSIFVDPKRSVATRAARRLHFLVSVSACWKTRLLHKNRVFPKWVGLISESRVIAAAVQCGETAPTSHQMRFTLNEIHTKWDNGLCQFMIVFQLIELGSRNLTRP